MDKPEDLLEQLCSAASYYYFLPFFLFFLVAAKFQFLFHSNQKNLEEQQQSPPGGDDSEIFFATFYSFVVFSVKIIFISQHNRREDQVELFVSEQLLIRKLCSENWLIGF